MRNRKNIFPLLRAMAFLVSMLFFAGPFFGAPVSGAGESLPSPQDETAKKNSGGDPGHIKSKNLDLHSNPAKFRQALARFRDDTPPTVSISKPVEGETVSGTLTLTATASDNAGIAGVQFRVDSENRCAEDGSAPYTCTWDTSREGDGTVTLTALVTDTSGMETISAPVTVTVWNIKGGGQPVPHPSGTIHVPEDHATLQEAVNAAGDGDLVLVVPGHYSGGVRIAGKSITLASHHHSTGDPTFIDRTTIAGGSPGIHVASTSAGTVIRGFRFTGGEKSIQLFARASVIENHFVENGGDAISFEDVGGAALGNVCQGAGDDCIDVDHPGDDVLIEDNRIDGSGDDGIEIRNGQYKGPLVTVTIRRNTITASGEDGIQIIDYAPHSNRRFVIEGNLIRTSADAGLGLMSGGETIEDFRAASVPERIHVFNNTFDGNPYGITGGDDLVAVNNIVSNCSVMGIKNADHHSIVAHTLFWNNGTHHVGSNVDAETTMEADPLYENAFELRPGSPAIDSGNAEFARHGETVLVIPQSEYSGKAPDLGQAEFSK